MKTKLLIASFLAGGLLFTQAASAHDETLGAVFGGITGAAIGGAIEGRDAAVAGAVIGALVGNAIANDGDHRGYREYRAPQQVVYTPAYPVYQAPPVYMEHYDYRRAPEWHHGWNEHRWDHDGDRRW